VATNKLAPSEREKRSRHAGEAACATRVSLLPAIHVGERPERVTVPDYARLLPAPIQRFTTRGVYDGEHVENRPSFPDAYQPVNWTCGGICAHESAMRGGAGRWLHYPTSEAAEFEQSWQAIEKAARGSSR
jgi:hypothetical protein